MIEYAYREKFSDHKRVDWIIVPAGTVITPVSGEEPDIPEDTAYIIDTEHLISESISIKESICSSKNLKFGQMEESYISFVIANDNIPSLADEMIDIYIYFDQDSDTIFQVGQYIVDKDQYTVDRRQRTIQAFDAIKTLKDWDITEWYNSYFGDGQRHMIGLVLVSLFNWVRDEQDEYKDSPKLPVYLNPDYVLCNGLFAIGRTIESDTITFGFFMNGLLEFNGCFGHIGRDGRFNCLTLSSYDKDPVRTVTDAFRLSPASYEDISTWGIGQIDVYDRNNIKKFSVQNTAKKHPNIYVMADPFVLADRNAGDQDVIAALKKMHEVIIHLNYTPNQTECTGDLSVEVGDRYNVRFTQKSEYDTKNWYRSYVLERTFSGIQSFKDTYTAKGDKKQPKYIVTNDRWHTGDSTSATDGNGTGGISILKDEHDRRLIQLLRNLGFRILDEPSNVEVVYNKQSAQIEIKWIDPQDFIRNRPVPATWAKTIVVRKEGTPPLHQWGVDNEEYGGDLLVTSTTRDEYSETPFIDDTIEPNKKYYYAIMPGSLYLDDADNPIYHYNWTKVISVDTARILVAPTLFTIQETGIEGVNVTVAYTIPVLEVGQYEVIKLVAKKDSIPLSIADGDKAIDLTPTPGMIVNAATMTGLDENSHYYFVIFIEDEQGNTATSEPMDCVTGESIIPEEIKEYVALINGCNGEGLDFFWKDYTINFPYGGYTDPKSFSYYLVRLSGQSYAVYNIVQEAFRSGFDDGYRYFTSHTTRFSLWIVNDNGTYKLYFRDYVPFIVGVNCSSFSSDTGLYSTGRYSQDGGQYYFQWYANSGSLVFPTGDDTVQRSDSSLVSLMEWCSKTFRNVNIYLDGVLISPAN